MASILGVWVGEGEAVKSWKGDYEQEGMRVGREGGR